MALLGVGPVGALLNTYFELYAGPESRPGGSQPQTIEPIYQRARVFALKLHAGWGPDSVVDRLKYLSLSPRGPGASALSQTPRINSACVKQLSGSIITTIPASLIFLSYSAKPRMAPLPWNPMRPMRKHLSLPTRGSGASARLGWQIGPNNWTYLPGGQGAGVLHTANQSN